MTKMQEDKLDAVAAAVQRLEANNVNLTESINKVLQIHIALKNDLDQLTNRVHEIETKIKSLPSSQPVSNETADMFKIQDKLDDLENCSRQSNILFFGIPDGDATESWEDSERHLKDFCIEKLGVTVASISRAHRLGRFSNGKTRPIIAKFYNEKEVESVLNLGYKLKGSSFSLSRDYYSEAVRQKRRRLWQFSKTIKKEGDRIRLSFNKLHVNNDVYIWDTPGNHAVRISKPFAV